MPENNNFFNTIEDAIEVFINGDMLVVVDDEDRENEGDLVCAAETITPEKINFMAKHGRGLICLPLDAEIVKRLNIPLMVNNNNATMGTNFTISIEASTGVQQVFLLQIVHTQSKLLLIRTRVPKTYAVQDMYFH